MVSGYLCYYTCEQFLAFFTSGDLEERIETFERDFVYHKLQEFGTSASYLNPYEVKLLDHLLSDYNPLN
jgi:hypothetical protein